MNERITKLTRKYFDFKKQIDALTEQLDLVKAEIKLNLQQEGLERIEDLDGNLVTYKSQTRESVDKKKVLALLGEIQFKEVVKSTTFDTLRITTAAQLEMLKSKRNEK